MEQVEALVTEKKRRSEEENKRKLEQLEQKKREEEARRRELERALGISDDEDDIPEAIPEIEAPSANGDEVVNTDEPDTNGEEKPEDSDSGDDETK